MSKGTEAPRYNVLSGRFNDQDNEFFRARAKEMGLSISELVHKALLEWKEGRCAAKNAEV